MKPRRRSSGESESPRASTWRAVDTGRQGGGVVRRLGLLGTLLVLELLGVSVWLDTEALAARTGLLGLIGDRGPNGLVALVGAVATLLALAYVSARRELERIALEIRRAPVAGGLLVAHFAALAGWLAVSRALFGGPLSHPNANLVAVLWLLLGTTAGVLAALAFVPRGIWLVIARGTRHVWVYAAIVAIASYLLKSLAGALWKPASDLTFSLVTASLRAFLPDLVADPATYTIGTNRFAVIISRECSGLEGAGLMLVFGTLWLWFLRREYRFPQAALLIPVGVGVMWLANILRIDLLLLIGHAGLRDVAAGGFHSQAGWIAFNAVALGLSGASRRVQWITKDETTRRIFQGSHENRVAPYLMPMLVILATGMVSNAASGGFEWLYPLRFFGAAAVLLHYRTRYKGLEWRAGWLAPAGGILVFGMWMALERFAGSQPDNGVVSGLASLSAPARAFWLVCRTLGAVVTVPIAEELAFRGYLMRRLVSSDFTSLSFQRVNLLAILISSLVFGILHGDRWLAGTLAGLIYTGAALWRGRIGDAVVAHATTNALIAAWVLLTGNWQLW